MEHTQVVTMVLQFLAESGYTQSCKTLQQESGVQYSEDEAAEAESSSTELEGEGPARGSKLLTALNEHYELMYTTNLSILNPADRAADAQILQKGDPGQLPKRRTWQLRDLHKMNILSAAFSPFADENLLFTGGADRIISVLDYEQHTVQQQLTAAAHQHTGGITSLAVDPQVRGRVLSTAMDCSLAITDVAAGGQLIARHTGHSKFVTRVKMSNDARFCATASYDRSCILYGRNGNGGDFEEMQRFYFGGAVEALAFTPDNTTLLVSAREDNLLHHIDLATLRDDPVNMNCNGDHHVSFTALDIAVSPDGRFTLVTTDRSRAIVFQFRSSRHLRNLYGLTNDGYSQPRACFDADSKFVFATSQNQHSWLTYELATQSVVRSVVADHSATLRDLAYLPAKNVLATVGFDKVVNVYTP